MPRAGSRWSNGRITRRSRYAAYLDSVAWRDKRREWYQHWTSTQSCAPACMVGYRWSLRSGHLHHLTYLRLGAEEPEDLIALCPAHHARLHQVWDCSTQWRRLGRTAATVGIIAMLRRQLEAADERAS